MYLLNRSALPINSNPGMVFPKATFSDSNEQLRYVHGGWLDVKVRTWYVQLRYVHGGWLDCATVEQSRQCYPFPK